MARGSVGVDGPRRHQACQNEVAVDLRQRRPSVEQISRIGMDTSKYIFQLHGVNTAEQPVLRKKLRRKEMFAFLEKLAPTVIAIEACGASHHCARLLQSFGHSVKLIAPQLVKPYIKRGKNDAADAEALCEAMSRPTMRFVPVKTAEQQAALMLVGVRDRLIRNRTQLSNAIRGYAGEFGLTAAKGKAHLAPLLERIHADESLPLGCCKAELARIATDGVAQLRAIADQPVTYADQHQGRLLLSRLHRHEAHRRPAHRLAKRFGVRRIVLPAFDVRLGQLRCDQLHRMPERLQQPRPMMACTAGFDRDHSRRNLLEECEHLLASQLLAQNRLLGGVHPVALENVFRRIHTNSANLVHGRPPLSEIYSDLILARLMPSGAVHTNRTEHPFRDFCRR